MGQRIKSESRFEWSRFLGLALAFYLSLAYPVLGLFWYHQYPMISPESLLIFLLWAGVAALLSFILQYARVSFENFFLVVVTVLALTLQFDLSGTAIALAAVTASAIAFIFGGGFRFVVLSVMVSLIVGAYFDNKVTPAIQTVPLSPEVVDYSHGPVIHLLMDGFIGPDGLAPESTAQQLKAESSSFFTNNGFELYTRAYSHYRPTLDSMTRVFNFRNDNANLWRSAVKSGERVQFKENKWFELLNLTGHQIVVYQSEFMDFCGVELSQEIICNTYPIPNLNTINQHIRSIGKRVQILLHTLVSQSIPITKFFRQRGLMQRWGVAIFDPRMLTSLKDDVAAQPGNAFFAHILIPHSPFIYDEDCNIDYSTEVSLRYEWAKDIERVPSELQTLKYGRIYSQVRCGMKLLDTFFRELRQSGLYEGATIIVHGDHGVAANTLVPSVANMNHFQGRDYREAFSALFAVKFPNGAPAIHEEPISLNEVMAQTAKRLFSEPSESLGIQLQNEQKHFIYFGGADPLRRLHVNIFEVDR